VLPGADLVPVEIGQKSVDWHQVSNNSSPGALQHIAPTFVVLGNRRPGS
jgi:hypothetical protein